MNCRECHDQLVPLVEGLLDDAAVQAVEAHLAACPTCRAEQQDTYRLCERLLAVGNAPIGPHLDQAVMDRILVQQVELTRRLEMRRPFPVFAVGALAGALLISLTWAALQYGPTTATAADSFARGVEAARNLQSIHLKCRMRTDPADNFEFLDLKHDFVDVELWKQFGPPVKWRIEKPARVAAMNGRETVMLIRDRFGVKLDVPAPAAFDTGWLHQLAAIDGVLSSELAADSLPGRQSQAKRVERPSDPAHETVSVAVDTGDDVGAYLKNKFLSTSNTRREYTFDRKTGRLENAKFYVRSDGQDVLVLEVVKIDYNPAIDDLRFELQVPQDVVWYQEPQRLPDNEKYEKMTPLQAARTFFDACSKRDWNEVAKFWHAPLTDEIKKYLGGFEEVKLGEPFQAKPYPGWFVPYEIRMVGGEVRKHNLALRKDNPAKRFIVDGGL
jgi:hypothetical protein